MLTVRCLLASFVSIVSLALGPRAHADWGKEVQLSRDGVKASLNENMGRCLIAEGSALHAVWTEAKGGDSAIHYRRSADRGASWSDSVRLSPLAGADSNPLLAKSGATLHLVFLRNAGTPQAASYYKRSTDDGMTWEPDVVLGATKWWPGVAAAGSMVYVVLNTVYADDAKNSVVYFRRSTDNGKTWEEQQPISTAPRRSGGRAEDPAIMADGKNVQIVWNDNRDATPGKGMAVYYRRSSDMGKTWGNETALSAAPEYTYFPTIYLNGNHADIAYGDRQSGHYDIFHRHSSDLGATWGPRQRITNTPGSGALYPAIVRDGSNVHLAWFAKGEVFYQRSRDAGKNWNPVVSLAPNGAMPFLATAGEAVYVIFTSERAGQRSVYFKCDLVGNKVDVHRLLPRGP